MKLDLSCSTTYLPSSGRSSGSSRECVRQVTDPLEAFRTRKQAGRNAGKVPYPADLKGGGVAPVLSAPSHALAKNRTNARASRIRGNRAVTPAFCGALDLCRNPPRSRRLDHPSGCGGNGRRQCGLGARLYLAGQVLETEQVFAVLIVVAVLGIAILKLQDAVDRRLNLWRTS